MSNTSEVRAVLASVVGDSLVASLKDDDPVFGGGVVDSLQLVEIIDRFQGEFGLEIDGEDLSPENFGSIAGMARFVERRRAPNEPGPVG